MRKNHVTLSLDSQHADAIYELLEALATVARDDLDSRDADSAVILMRICGHYAQALFDAKHAASAKFKLPKMSNIPQ